MKKYLVRPNDFHIFELDESNNCYRSLLKNAVFRGDGSRVNAQKHFTYENLVNNYGFFPIDESEIEFYDKKHDEHYEFLNWQHRSDGHGDIKGGSYEEFLAYKKRVEEYNKTKNNSK